MEPLTGLKRAASKPEHLVCQTSAGKYTFRVQTTPGSKSESSTRSLSIIILPPWWQSIIAILYIPICIILIVVGTILWSNTAEKLLEERQKAVRDRKEKELYESKWTFHRDSARSAYPLTLINGPLKPLRKWRYRSPR